MAASKSSDELSDELDEDELELEEESELEELEIRIFLWYILVYLHDIGILVMFLIAIYDNFWYMIIFGIGIYMILTKNMFVLKPRTKKLQTKIFSDIFVSSFVQTKT